MISWGRSEVWNVGGDAGLARAAARGDRRAFDALVHVYEPRLRGFLLCRVGPEAADDVLQETWLAAWAALPSFARRSCFKAWLFGIAVHKAADAGRASGRTSAEAWSDVAGALPPAGPDQFAASDMKRSVQATLARLPPAQREVLELYYYVDLTLAEVAETLGRNLNTVKYQFYRAHVEAADGLREYDPARDGEQT